ncbi:hypothetical protein BMG_5025 [Priestia megaterium]|nr:hypothetical protein BMG_5025 [Priestia megaterium]
MSAYKFSKKAIHDKLNGLFLLLKAALFLKKIKRNKRKIHES